MENEIRSLFNLGERVHHKQKNFKNQNNTKKFINNQKGWTKKDEIWRKIDPKQCCAIIPQSKTNFIRIDDGKMRANAHTHTHMQLKQSSLSKGNFECSSMCGRKVRAHVSVQDLASKVEWWIASFTLHFKLHFNKPQCRP